jgi:NAD(P)-dependent dehydrogenase (short-subunit alcohol dehydrogenase family)
MTREIEELLRDGLLAGTTVALAAAPGPAAGSPAAAIADRAAVLGAGVQPVELHASEDAAAGLEATLAEIVSGGAGSSSSALVVDAAGAFARVGGREGLVRSLAATWNAARAAGVAFIAAERGGKILVIGPAAGGEHAPAALASLENLARTLSIEWARHGITAVALAPGADTPADDIAALVCWLLSPAGAYFSGCLLDLRGSVAQAGR